MENSLCKSQCTRKGCINLSGDTCEHSEGNAVPLTKGKSGASVGSAAATAAETKSPTPWYKRAKWKSTPDQAERDMFAEDYLSTIILHVRCYDRIVKP